MAGDLGLWMVHHLCGAYCITGNLGLDYGAGVRAASIWGSSKLGNNDMPWSLSEDQGYLCGGEVWELQLRFVRSQSCCTLLRLVQQQWHSVGCGVCSLQWYTSGKVIPQRVEFFYKKKWVKSFFLIEKAELLPFFLKKRRYVFDGASPNLANALLLARELFCGTWPRPGASPSSLLLVQRVGLR